MRYERISADCHLDMIWLPPDLFTSEAPAHLKDRDKARIRPSLDQHLARPGRKRLRRDARVVP